MPVIVVTKTIRLSWDLAVWLEKHAAETETSQSQIVCSALAEHRKKLDKSR